MQLDIAPGYSTQALLCCTLNQTDYYVSMPPSSFVSESYQNWRNVRAKKPAKIEVQETKVCRLMYNSSGSIQNVLHVLYSEGILLYISYNISNPVSIQLSVRPKHTTTRMCAYVYIIVTECSTVPSTHVHYSRYMGRPAYQIYI